MKQKLFSIVKRNYILSQIMGTIRYIWSRTRKNKLYRDIMEYTNNQKIIRDVFFSILHYEIVYFEYFTYSFYDLNNCGRKKYMGRGELSRVVNTVGPASVNELFTDKYECYLKYKEFYKREIIKLQSDEKQKFIDFCNKHKEFFVKPYNGKKGNGAFVVSSNQDYEKVYQEKIYEKGIFVLEELIQQSERMAQFHPESINTIRIATIMNANNVNILYAMMRMGRGKSVVDNIGSGGLASAIDLNTGIIISKGKDEKAETFVVHPDTNIPIVGFQLPEWNEAIAMVKEMAQIIPEYRFVSWDLAHTNKGWVVVEINGRRRPSGNTNEY